MFSTNPARTQTSADRYSQQAARVREKAAAVISDSTLREQLFDLARHYNQLARVAASSRAAHKR